MSIAKLRIANLYRRHIEIAPLLAQIHIGVVVDRNTDAALGGASLGTSKVAQKRVSELLQVGTDAEILLGRRISTDADMEEAANILHDMGPEWVLLRGGTFAKGRINALLSGPNCQKFFSSVNIEGWQRHGVGGTLSTAIAARLAQEDDVPTAITNAHNYMHSQVVYASAQPRSLQPHNLYNRFMTLLAQYYTTAHDVSFYAMQLSISTRYLSQITSIVCGRSPKQVIDDYLIQECEQMLSTTSLTIQQISNQLGFTSQIAFAKFFKSRKGCSPTFYRERRTPR